MQCSSAVHIERACDELLAHKRIPTVKISTQAPSALMGLAGTISTLVSRWLGDIDVATWGGFVFGSLIPLDKQCGHNHELGSGDKANSARPIVSSHG